MAAEKPVLIVGAGPTGMTAAMELARFGIPIRLVEKQLQPATTSRALGVQARTLELFEQRGLGGEMVRAGSPAVAANVHGGGKRIFRLDFAHVESRYPYILILSQAETERILREELARQGVAIERGVELVALAQTQSYDPPRPTDGVSATLRHQDGTLEEVAASYLIGAEGAHSLVRSSLDLAFAGKAFQEEYGLGDFSIEGDLPDNELQVFSSADGFMAMFPLGGHHFRLIVSNPLGDPKRGTDPTLDELQTVYDARSVIPAKFHDLTWSSWFRINSRMVERLRHGRIFLGGDSAHIHSPAAGQGMNTGIQDMINLSWKLALVIQGEASPELLATYDEDRLPVIRNVLNTTESLTEAIGSENSLVRAAFNHIIPLVVGTNFVQDKATAQMSQVALGYRASSLSTTAAHHGHLRAGDRVPDLNLTWLDPISGAEGSTRPERLFALLDPSRCTLLLINLADPAGWDQRSRIDLFPWADWIPTRQVQPAADPQERRHLLDNFGTHPAIALIRPDSYLGFLGDESSLPELVAYLERWFPTGSPPASPDQ